MADVDALMAELGINTPAPSAAAQQPQQPTSEVDALMAELGVAPGISTGVPTGVPTTASVPGLASGPGAGWAASANKPVEAGPALIPIAVPGKAKVLGPGGKEVAMTTPDGRPIEWTGPTCARCNNGAVGQVVNALGKQWHPECFICGTCQKPFPGGAFLEHEAKPYCENDYHALFCPTCHNCKQPITAKCVTAGDLKFHPHHFVCTGCGADLMDAKYANFEGAVYCLKCHGKNVIRKEKPIHTCGKCKLPIYGDYIIFNNMPVHAEHFQCEECGIEFKSGNAREWEGGLYCNPCYAKMAVQKCGSCNKPIKGRSITALGRVWHPEHFVCTTCHDPLSGGSFFERDDKPYCEAHYVQQFGERCAKCNLPVATEVIHFEGKIFHTDHFCCHACEKPLGGKKAFQWESKPMCAGCFDKLPDDVKKRIRRTVAEKKKAEKARQKAAKKK